MESLHLVRTAPDERTEDLFAELSGGGNSQTIALYDPEVDYDELVRAIFAARRVISWW